MQLLRDPRVFIRENAARYGDVWRSRIPAIGPGKRLRDLVWLMGPEGAERILAPQHRDDFSWYGGYGFTMEPTFGRDILFLSDDTPGCPAHKERHRTLSPAFHPRTDGDYLPVIESVVKSHTRNWRPGTRIDLQWELKRIAFHVVAALLLGAEERDLDQLMHLFEDLGDGLYSILRVRLPGFDFYRGQRAREKLAAYLREKIAGYRCAPELPRNMIGYLMRFGAEDERALSDETLVAEMLAFLFAGYDTTASMLTSFFAAVIPRAEIVRILRQEASELRFSELQSQPMLEATLLETERLFPPLVFSMRGVERDITFRNFTIAAGSRVAYSAWQIGRMPSLFERAGEFLPERFFDDKKAPPYSILGFGGGPRTCIGKRFASLEMRLVIALLFRSFSFGPQFNADDEMFFNPTMQRRQGLRIEIRA